MDDSRRTLSVGISSLVWWAKTIFTVNIFSLKSEYENKDHVNVWMNKKFLNGFSFNLNLFQRFLKDIEKSYDGAINFNIMYGDSCFTTEQS